MSKKILVVDDSAVETMYFKGFAGKIDDVTFEYAGSHEAAIRLCGQEKFDLILIDECMPEGDAFGLLAAIREIDDLNKSTPALVMGSAADFSEDEYLEKTGFVNYLEKPVDFYMLKAAISMYA
ncbi:response regulator [Butyrivibrio sp. WCD3002]|uniref:response regulator n=1 Tax=Butyrivibrio sp. WCD3002 TaxID=1280676 RepID=UPI0003F5BC86|nr:response regulator [Butyrivibrio sp. WCD3002]